MEDESILGATYSLEDDKLRLYVVPYHRLSDALYQQIKTLGFIWAPRQNLFTQVWSPEREDLLLALAGDITEEETTVEERAQARSQRFDTYSDHAEERAVDAQSQVEQITGEIPLGQPILVGHHSERKARRDAEKIERGIARAIEEFKKAEYWEHRARRVLAHADRRDRPDVIYRRIQKLEADLRKFQREADPENPDWVIRALYMTREGKTKDEIQAIWRAKESRAQRWIEHLENRLTYERILYTEGGGVPAEQKPLEVGGAVYVWGKWKPIVRVNSAKGRITSVSVPSGYTWNDKVTLDKIQGIKTKAEYEAFQDGQITEADVALERAKTPHWQPQEKPWEALKNIKVEAVGDIPGFVPSPPALVARIIAKAQLEPSLFVLEPEAGKGDIADAARRAGCAVTCVEINPRLCQILTQKRHTVHQVDFLSFCEGRYDRVLMNPPFENHQDIQHIYHAYDLLNPGGILVAVVSESPFYRDDQASRDFRAWFTEMDPEFELLPDDTFKDSGVNISSRLIVIRK